MGRVCGLLPGLVCSMIGTRDRRATQRIVETKGVFAVSQRFQVNCIQFDSLCLPFAYFCVKARPGARTDTGTVGGSRRTGWAVHAKLRRAIA